jgi:DNA-binding Xre family transcriptional regulator
MEQESLSDLVRRAVRAFPLNQGQIASSAGIQEANLSRFMNGKDLTTSTLDRLCEVLGLEVAPIRMDLYAMSDIGHWVLQDRLKRAAAMDDRLNELEKQLTTRMDRQERLLTELLTELKAQRSGE